MYENLYQLTEFIIESNAIEGEHSLVALYDSLSAWQRGEHVKGIAVSDILDLHYDIMKTIYPRVAGNIRTVAVTVGGKLCPLPALLPSLLRDWVQKFAKAKTASKIIQGYAAFEKIHPFEDGNGRVGRMIMNLQLVREKLPLSIIHRGIEQQEYYKLFK